MLQINEKGTLSLSGSVSWILGYLILDQKGIYQKQPKKEAVWGHWEVIGIGEPIFDQKLRPIVAEEVIKILFPCFWSDAINSCENPKSKKYKKKIWKVETSFHFHSQQLTEVNCWLSQLHVLLCNTCSFVSHQYFHELLASQKFPASWW